MHGRTNANAISLILVVALCALQAYLAGPEPLAAEPGSRFLIVAMIPWFVVWLVLFALPYVSSPCGRMIVLLVGLQSVAIGVWGAGVFMWTLCLVLVSGVLLLAVALSDVVWEGLWRELCALSHDMRARTVAPVLEKKEPTGEATEGSETRTPVRRVAHYILHGVFWLLPFALLPAVISDCCRQNRRDESSLRERFVGPVRPLLAEARQLAPALLDGDLPDDPPEKLSGKCLLVDQASWDVAPEFKRMPEDRWPVQRSQVAYLVVVGEPRAVHVGRFRSRGDHWGVPAYQTAYTIYVVDWRAKRLVRKDDATSRIYEKTIWVGKTENQSKPRKAILRWLIERTDALGGNTSGAYEVLE